LFNSNVLDVAIGLAFVYLLLGLMCTVIVEWVSGILRTRAHLLEEGIRRLLNGPAAGTYQVRVEDLKDPGSLLETLRDSDDPLPKFIRDNASPEAKAAFSSYAGNLTQDLLDVLVMELNRQISNPDLFDRQRFPRTRLSPQETEAGRRNPKQLEKLNRRLLQEAFHTQIASLSDDFYGHPLIRALSQRGGRPSYVPARTFATAIVDIMAPAAVAGKVTFSEIREGIGRLPDSDIRRALLALLQDIDEHAGNAVDQAKLRIESWFNDAMDRVSGWFKRRTQLVAAIAAVVVTLLTNADSMQMARRLWTNPTLRAQIVEEARVRAAGPRPLPVAEYVNPDDPMPDTPEEVVVDEASADPNRITDRQRQLLGDLISWSDDFRRLNELIVRNSVGRDPRECSAANDSSATCAKAIEQARIRGDAMPGWEAWTSRAIFPWVWYLLLVHFFGWALSATAVSLGAPFWFDTLNRFMNLRSSGKSPEERARKPAKPGEPERSA